MLDITKREHYIGLTVSELINVLKTYEAINPHMNVDVDGDSSFYIHVSVDEDERHVIHGIGLDSSSLEEFYAEQDAELAEANE